MLKPKTRLLFSSIDTLQQYEEGTESKEHGAGDGNSVSTSGGRSRRSSSTSSRSGRAGATGGGSIGSKGSGGRSIGSTTSGTGVGGLGRRRTGSHGDVAGRSSRASTRRKLAISGCGALGELAVVLKRAGRVGLCVLVDDHGHTLGAVRSLAAEEPEGLGVVDHDGENGDVVLVGRDGHEGGEDSGLGGVDVVDGLARVVKVRLGQTVIAVEELELNHGTGLGLDLLGPESRTGLAVDGVLADRDDLHLGGCGVVSKRA